MLLTNVLVSAECDTACLAGASSKQSSIMHMTLGRVLNAHQLSLEQRQAVQDRCTQWTQKLQGMPFKPNVLW